MNKKINTKDISVVVQGAIHPKYTQKCLRSIRKYLPGATIILSTWEGSNDEGLDYDKLLLNKDPGTSGYRENVYKNKSGTKTPNNVNRQIVSTLQGLKEVKTKYAMKIRTDFYLKGNKFLKYFFTLQDYDKNYELKLFDKKIIAYLTMPKNSAQLPYYISDHSFFGQTDDLLKLWDIPLQTEETSLYFEHNHPVSIDIYNTYDGGSSRFDPERYIVLNAIYKKDRTIFDRIIDWTDVRNNNLENGYEFIANNFIVLDNRQFKLYAGKEYLKCLKDFRVFEFYLEMYMRYCSKNIPLKYFLSVEEKAVAKLKKDYKYFYTPIEKTVKWLFMPFRILFDIIDIFAKYFNKILKYYKLNINETAKIKAGKEK